MSQDLVFALLEELGGRAPVSKLKELAKEKYPNLSLYKYVGNRLAKLHKWGRVDHDKKEWWIKTETR